MCLIRALGRAALLPLLKESASGWMRDNAMRLSAAVSFYSILSLAPLLVAQKRVGNLFDRDRLLFDWRSRHFGPPAESQALLGTEPLGHGPRPRTGMGSETE